MMFINDEDNMLHWLMYDRAVYLTNNQFQQKQQIENGIENSKWNFV